jgi:hypothetical protein
VAKTGAVGSETGYQDGFIDNYGRFNAISLVEMPGFGITYREHSKKYLCVKGGRPAHQRAVC